MGKRAMGRAGVSTRRRLRVRGFRVVTLLFGLIAVVACSSDDGSPGLRMAGRD